MPEYEYRSSRYSKQGLSAAHVAARLAMTSCLSPYHSAINLALPELNVSACDYEVSGRRMYAPELTTLLLRAARYEPFFAFFFFGRWCVCPICATRLFPHSISSYLLCLGYNFIFTRHIWILICSLQPEGTDTVTHTLKGVGYTSIATGAAVSTLELLYFARSLLSLSLTHT